jgi:hypothetical protein
VCSCNVRVPYVLVRGNGEFSRPRLRFERTNSMALAFPEALHRKNDKHRTLVIVSWGGIISALVNLPCTLLLAYCP